MYRYKKIIGVITIFTLLIFMKTDYNIAFSATSNGESGMGGSENISEIPKNQGVELDGVIGEWDLREEVSGKLDSLDEGDIEGSKPNSEDYFTISVTVPANMEFGVYRNSSKPEMGYFYSPKYKITNNGSKLLDVRVGFDKGNGTDPKKNLFVAKPVKRNGKVEIDLGFSYDKGGKKTRVDLTGDLSDINNRVKVGSLSANEEAKVTFVSDNWEPISWEPTVNETVNFLGSLILEFSYENNNETN